MIERGGGAGFLREALQALGIRRERSRENLDGDVAVETGITGPVNLSHASGADGRLNFVGA
jgi:hypothetical protein